MIKDSKLLTIEQATAELNNITNRLIMFEQDFSVVHRFQQKTITITAAKACESVKIACPKFVFRFDERGQKYVELIIKYECEKI